MSSIYTLYRHYMCTSWLHTWLIEEHVIEHLAIETTEHKHAIGVRVVQRLLLHVQVRTVTEAWRVLEQVRRVELKPLVAFYNQTHVHIQTSKLKIKRLHDNVYMSTWWLPVVKSYQYRKPWMSRRNTWRPCSLTCRCGCYRQTAASASRTRRHCAGTGEGIPRR